MSQLLSVGAVSYLYKATEKLQQFVDSPHVVLMYIVSIKSDFEGSEKEDGSNKALFMNSPQLAYTMTEVACIITGVFLQLQCRPPLRSFQKLWQEQDTVLLCPRCSVQCTHFSAVEDTGRSTPPAACDCRALIAGAAAGGLIAVQAVLWVVRCGHVLLRFTVEQLIVQ